MDYIASIISENASFFDTYGNLVLIPLFLIILIGDYKLSKRTFTFSLVKKFLGTSLFILALALGSLIYMTNFPLKPMVKSISKVQSNIGQQIHDFNFLDVRKDSIYNISDFNGKLIILNFWGTYCPPCIEEFPDLKQIETNYSDKVSVIALTDENKEKIMKFIQKVISPDIVGTYSSNEWIDLENFRPLTIIIDEEGIIREYFFGKKDYNFFKSLVEKYF